MLQTFILVILMAGGHGNYSVNTDLRFETKEQCETAKIELYKDAKIRSTCVEMPLKQKKMRCEVAIQKVGNGLGTMLPALKEIYCTEE